MRDLKEREREREKERQREKEKKRVIGLDKCQLKGRLQTRLTDVYIV
jgi:hypothetical protein